MPITSIVSRNYEYLFGLFPTEIPVRRDATDKTNSPHSPRARSPYILVRSIYITPCAPYPLQYPRHHFLSGQFAILILVVLFVTYNVNYDRTPAPNIRTEYLPPIAYLISSSFVYLRVYCFYLFLYQNFFVYSYFHSFVHSFVHSLDICRY